jgi:hypothetical protein
MRFIPLVCWSALLANTTVAAPLEAPLEAFITEEGSGLVFLSALTDVGRAYQVEWSSTLTAANWIPAAGAPAEGTGGRQSFYLGQRPDFDGPPPSFPPRLDFTLLAYADGTSLAQWQQLDGTLVYRPVALDFRQVPRLASAVTGTATVVTRTQLADYPQVGIPPETPETDPHINAAVAALIEAYPQLQTTTADTTVKGNAETGPLVGTRFWRLRRLERDADRDGLSDFHEWHVAATYPLRVDSDGDGATDGVEVAAGSLPADFFNGVRPVLARVPSRWGDIPFTGPGEWLDEPLVLEVRSPSGTPLALAPVTVTASAGELALWGRPSAGPAATPVLTGRTDGNGRISLAWRAGGLGTPVSQIHAWSGRNQEFQGTHFLAYTLRALPSADRSVLAWLRADAGVTTETGARVTSWADPIRQITATATDTQRPLLNTSGPLPMIEFNGTQRMALNTTLGGPTLSAIFVAQPTATRSQPALSSGDPKNRTPGLSSQRYLLAGEVATGPSPWSYTASVPRQLQTVQYFSRYTALSFNNDPINGFRGYNCRDISYSFGQLPPALPVAYVPSLRYDITPGALPDPGPARRVRGRTYRLNPAVPSCPLLAGASVSAVMDDFPSRRGLPTTYEWEPKELATYARRAGNPPVEDFREIYYEARGYTPAIPEKYELQPGLIGNVGHGISLGTNSAGYFQLAQSFAPALGSRPTPAAPPPSHLTSVIITNGQAVFYTNGSSPVSSLPPAGGTATGFRSIGALTNATNGFAGMVGDLIIASEALTDESRRNAEDTLAAHRRLPQVDRDADSLPDWWERRSLTVGTTATASDNPDADSLTNAQEYARFTLPEIADSDTDGLPDATETAAAAVTPDTDHDGLLDGVDSTPTNPANGHADANADGTPDGLASLVATPGQRDTDRDTVSDFVESAVTRTNPFNPDTDGDSLPDGWEIKEQLDPNNPSGEDGPQGDPDSDGQTNAEEWVLGTRPHTAG